MRAQVTVTTMAIDDGSEGDGPIDRLVEDGLEVLEAKLMDDLAGPGSSVKNADTRSTAREPK